MFTDETVETLAIESLWRKSQQSEQESKSCQTAPLKTAEAEVQVLLSLESSNQTDADEDLSHSACIVQDGQAEHPGLGSFLNRVADVVIRELIKNSRSHAFDGFRVNWEDQNETVSRLHWLQYSEAQERGLHVTSLSWNCTGSVITCAFGRVDDGDWSTEKSYVCTWNLDRRGLDPKRPDVVIEVVAAVNCVSFHPSRPSLIAGGLYNGEVVVWDTSRTLDPVLAHTGMSPDMHRDPVCQVRWVPWHRRGEFAVLSAGSGGRVLLWTLEEGSRLLLSSGYALTRQQLPHKGLASKARGGSSVGIASLALSPWDVDTFLVGSEGGLVLKCSFSASETAEVVPDGESVTLRAPAQLSFSPRCGPVCDLHCSPFHRNVFVSVGTDGFAHVHTLLQPEPLVSVRVGDSYVFAVRWSPTRPLLFAAATGEGSVQIFDLALTSLKAAATIKQNTTGVPVYCLEFNPQQTHLLAAGHANGTISVWHLSSTLTEQGPKEAVQLDQLANGVTE